MIGSDREMRWRSAGCYIPAWQFQGIQQKALTGSSMSIDTVLTSAGTSVAPLTEVNATGNMGVLMMTDGMEINHTMLLPDDFDLYKPMRVRVHWTSGSADVTDTVLWKVRFLPIVPNTTALISAATALDTVIVSQTVPAAVAYTWSVTSWGEILPIPGNLTEDMELIQWEVEMDTKAAALGENTLFMGLEIAYTPRRLVDATGMDHEAKRSTYVAGKMSAN